MQHFRLWQLLLFSFLVSCSSSVTDRRLESLPLAGDQIPLSVIALGSCNSQDRKQPLWAEILKNKPQLWVWLGDNNYGDTDDMAVLAAKYQKQLQNPLYRNLLQNIPVIGTWDDHDYGRNNAGKEYPHRQQSAQLFWDFMGEPRNSPRRKQKGVYSSHTYGPEGQQVKIILLDVRYHRDAPAGQNPTAESDSAGDMLGMEQWHWLETELRTSTAQFHFIGSGLQVIASDHGYEKWGNFPAARKRLFDLVARTQAANVIFLSGDRHFAEVSRLEWPGVPYPLYDLTTSGLTHSWKGGLAKEFNRHRMGHLHDKLNFGLLRIRWDQVPTMVEFEIRGRRNKLHEQIKVAYSLDPTVTLTAPKQELETLN